MHASGDGEIIYGVTDSLLFNYDVSSRDVRSGGYVASPPLGPRAVSVSKTGDYYFAGWGQFDRLGLLSQFQNPKGELNVGSHAVDSERGLVYAQIPDNVTVTTSSGGTEPVSKVPYLMVSDADNLTVREKLRLPENLAGKGLLSPDGTVMYALSESGIMILPVGHLGEERRVAASKEDLLFRSNYCNPGVVKQEITIYDPSGGNTPFTLVRSTPGIRLSANSGVTPATIEVSIDPSAYVNQKGTITGTIDIVSDVAVNIPDSIRVLMNLPEPDQRGTSVNVPGQLVDLIADPSRNRFYVLRQDRNQVLVYDGSSYEMVATLRTGNTPTSMAVTFDRRWLLVGNDNSQFANVFDLETLEASTPVRFPFGHYPRWIAASGRSILAATRVAGPVHKIDRVDMLTRTAAELPTLGVYENNININTAMVASSNGGSILIAQADGNLLLYNSNADAFTVSRKLDEPEKGAIAASNFDDYVVGDTLFNASLVAVHKFDTAVGQSSGFLFVDTLAYRTGASSAGDPGVIQRVNLASGTGARATRMVEAPVLGKEGAVFTRTLALLPNRTSLVNLTVSGFTVLAWNYDSSVAVPLISRVVNAADKTKKVAPGGLIIVEGTNLSAVNIATKEKPLPLAMGEACLTVNGLPVPMFMVSPTQINAQLPFQVEGNVTMILRTSGGVSDNYNVTILPTAPSVFRIPLQPDYEVASIIREANGQPVTIANPIRGKDKLTIYLTGMGKTDPEIPAGQPTPDGYEVAVLTPPEVDINGWGLAVEFAGMVPGEVGVYEIRCSVPEGIPEGLEKTLRIIQGGSSTSLAVRVIR
jgi:uncharacterized protein (TIGR03437 family)